MMYNPETSMETIKGVLFRTNYRSESFAIGTFRVIENGKFTVEIPVVGSLPLADKEEVLEVRGQWETHKSYGKQFKVSDSWRDYPVSIEGLERYLSTYISNIGPTRARAIVDKFETMSEVEKVLNQEPHRLIEVVGISNDRAAKIKASWDKESQDRRLKVFLSAFDFSEAMSRRVINHFGAQTQAILSANPYRLAEVEGIGFKIADKGAIKMGWGTKTKERHEAACLYTMLESQKEGHSFLHLKQVEDKMVSLTKATEEETREAIGVLHVNRTIECSTLAGRFGEMKVVYLPSLLSKEISLAARVKELLDYPHRVPPNLEANVEKIQASMNIVFAEKQKTAMAKALSNHLSIINGGPGTGKTTTVRGLIAVAESLGLNYVLAAPTGRAAKRLFEVTGKPATTIHKLLEFDSDNGTFRRNRSNPLDADLLVLDETSMNELSLQFHVLNAISDNCSVVMIGDVDQLPSVGPGMVLRDFIESGVIEVTTLDTIFRQAEGSLIIRNAHLIRAGVIPKFPPKGSVANSYLMSVPKTPNKLGKKVDDVEWVKKTLVTLCQEHIPQKLKIDPVRDVQILVPMKVHDAGAYEFNKVLQAALNPSGQHIRIRDNVRFRMGDRVMQLKNDYQTNLSNGDIGFIVADDPENGVLSVEFQGNVVPIPYENTEHLQLAYAQTIHKSQGSEYKVVIIVLLMQHYTMLERNLLYTANTRAKQMCLYLASPGAIERAVKVSGVHQRNTFLAERIRYAVTGSY